MPEKIQDTLENSATIEKYKQIIQNCIKHSLDENGKIAEAKLIRIVYLSDFLRYYTSLVSMSGLDYRKLQRGPITDEYYKSLDEMIENNIIIRETKDEDVLFSLAKETVPADRLTEDELELIKRVGSVWKNRPTSEIINYTNSQLPYQICRDGEIIPYSLITQEEPEHIYEPI